MEFSWTTFLLELINFLALVWILRRLFIRPVKAAIEARKAAISQALESAERKGREARELEERFSSRLKDWETEKAGLRKELQAELENEKAARLKQVEALASREREKIQAQERQRIDAELAAHEKDAITQALAFVSRLLAGLASPGLEASIIEQVGFSLKAAPRPGTGGGGGLDGTPKIEIRSAFPVSPAQRETLQKAIRERLGGSAPEPDYFVDPSLIAGVEVGLGPVVLKANLRDELRFFAEAGGA